MGRLLKLEGVLSCRLSRQRQQKRTREEQFVEMASSSLPQADSLFFFILFFLSLSHPSDVGERLDNHWEKGKR